MQYTRSQGGRHGDDDESQSGGVPRNSNPDEQARGTETSVKRRLDDGRRFIARHPDWTVAGEDIDEAKSAVLGEDKRPG